MQLLLKPVFFEPESDLRDLPFIIDVASTPLFKRINILPHPFLGKEPLLKMLKTVWPDDGYTHICKPDIALRVTIAIE
jgi:hypothetical protein